MKKLMVGVFKYNTIIQGHSCSINNTLSLSSLMKEIQQIGTTHLDEIGITYDILLKEGIVFVLSKVAMKIYRLPSVGEEIIITTTPQGVKGASLLRKVQLGTLDGELLVDCQSAWLIIDPIDRKILRPKNFAHTLPSDEDEPDNIKTTSIHIEIPTTTNPIYIKEVRYTDMDLNLHVNNTVYGDIVMDAIPYNISSTKEITSFIIHYRKEARLGEKISVYREKIGDNSFFIGGSILDEPCFSCNISFK